MRRAPAWRLRVLSWHLAFVTTMQKRGPGSQTWLRIPAMLHVKRQALARMLRGHGETELAERAL
jgi:hypothetical protein